GGPNAALISYKLWRNRFQGDEQAIGKQLHLGKWSYTVVGVLPPDFAIPSHATDIWAVSPPDGPYGQARESTWFTAIGRMKPTMTVSQARADLANVQAQLGRQYPKTDKNLVATLRPLKLTIVGESRSSLLLLFCSVSLLLLIACTNIAALLLARTAERSREIAVRTSLGASRTSIVMQLLTESFTLALAGSACGLFVAWGATHVFQSFAKALPRVEEIALDWRIAVYALACALVSTVLFGLVPALQATRSGTAGLLAAHSRTQVSGNNPMQWLLVGIQMALAATLLIGAALLLRSFQALGHVSPGFDASHVLTLSISADWSETVDQKKLIRRINNDLDAIRSVPGVQSAATSASLPGAADQYPTKLHLEGRSSTDGIASDGKVVSAGYFETMRIPLIAGQGCTDKTGWATAVVNRSFADTFLGGQLPVGRHVGWADNPYGTPPSQIIGVAADARENGLHHAPAPIVYWCANNPNMAPHFLVRTEGDPLRAGAPIRRALAKVEPGRSVFDVVPLEELLFDASSENRFRTLLLTLFALTAIMLAAIGLYGTLSYFVSLRHREVGLRIALGAMPKEILGRFFRQGLTVAFLGCAAGLALGAALSGVLSGMLFGVSRADAVSYAGVAAMVLLVAAAASVLPAMRAARLDPMRSLRDE
ncbi:MAG: ADOP family duplicated permease, partial [Acidobacteriota bacterium]|nr:ADOP family duplicated permease [Acidobacteriota bacterium]